MTGGAKAGEACRENVVSIDLLGIKIAANFSRAVTQCGSALEPLPSVLFDV